MTFPVNNSVTATWFNTLMNDLLSIQSYGQQITTSTAGGGAVASQTVLNLATWCVSLRSDIATVAANTTLETALVTYFQQQLNTTSLQITTEFGTLNTLAGNILTALGTDYPHDSNGFLADRTFNLSTGLVWVSLTAAQLPNTMPAIAAFNAEL